MLNTASGATWVSIHHGGGVGMGYSQHAGMVVLADGTDDAERKLARFHHRNHNPGGDSTRYKGSFSAAATSPSP